MAHNGTTAPLCVIIVTVPLYAGQLSLFIAHLVGRIVSGVRVSASFQIILRLVAVGRLGKDYTMCTAAKTYEIGQNRLKLAE